MGGGLERMGIPLVLFGSLWGAVGVVLQAYKAINERRDEIFKLIETCGDCTERILTPDAIYWTNLLPLSTGLVLFLFIVSWLMLCIPKFAQTDDQQFVRQMRFLSRFVASLPIFALLGFIGGGIFDFYIIMIQH